MQPGKFTELFFLDEATAFAAGHRPCALCRREDYNRFLELTGADGADEIDDRLHLERLGEGGARRLHRTRTGDVPQGAFVVVDSRPWLAAGDRLLRWSPGGYTDRAPIPAGHVEVLTPPTLVDVLRNDWTAAVPLVHPSAVPLKG